MARTYRIQIVEDQYFIAMDYQHALTDAGYECTSMAAFGEQAVDLAARDRPDVVLMDVTLAGQIDGIETAHRIYRDLGIRSVFCTAHQDAATQERGERGNPLAWVSKPVDRTELVEVLRRVTQAL